MKIINTVHATKNSMIAVSGSTTVPIFNQVAPVGSQLNVLPMGFSANAGVRMALKKMTIAPTKDKPAPVSAVQWLVRLDRFKNNTINTNAARGGSGSSQTD